MAAIDKIYVNSYEKYKTFRDWCKNQPLLSDKYGKKASLLNFVYSWDSGEWEGERPIFNAPYYVDAYVIRNCPFDFIQKELMLNYGYWSQERILRFYNDVKEWDNTKGECPYWAKLEDFIILDDGTMTIKGLEKSDYEKIKDGELYTSPSTNLEYEIGKHFRCTKHPKEMFNTPFGCKMWFVQIDTEQSLMWYNSTNKTWDFAEEFVFDGGKSNTAFVKTIKALKRMMLKWKLPVGTKVVASGRYVQDTYEFVITK